MFVFYRVPRVSLLLGPEHIGTQIFINYTITVAVSKDGMKIKSTTGLRSLDTKNFLWLHFEGTFFLLLVTQHVGK